MSVPKSNTIAHLDSVHSRTNSLDNTNTLMAQHLSRLEIVFVCTTETRVCGFNKHLVVFKSAAGLVGHNSAFGGTAENVKGDAHFSGGDLVGINLIEVLDFGYLGTYREWQTPILSN